MRKASAFGGCRNSRFADEYARGVLPCRIDHGTCTHRIKWDAPVGELCARRDHLLSLCADGLRETKHPFATIARLAFSDLLRLEGAGPISDDSLRSIMTSLRAALMAANVPGDVADGSSTFGVGLVAVKQIAIAEGARLVPHVHVVLPPIGKRMFSKAHSEAIRETLRDLKLHGGPGVARVMNRSSVVAGVR